jgi:DNA polymerase-4
MLVVPEAETTEFLRPLPVSALWGIGPKASARLQALGLFTVGDVAEARRQTLASNLGKAQAEHLLALAHGVDPRPVTPERVEKSVSAENTYFHTLTGHEQVETELARLSHKVAGRLRAKSLQTRTIGLKLRAADFSTYTRDVTIERPTDLAHDIHHHVTALWRTAERDVLAGRPIRLLGVRAGGLVDAGSVPVQLTLDDAEPDPPRRPRWDEAERALDAVTARFGGGALRPASTLRRPPHHTGATDNPAPGS